MTTELLPEGIVHRPTVPRVDVELQHEIEQFCYHEAALLDEREYDDWLELFAEDIHYWMPTRYNRLRREMHREFSASNETHFFDEDYDSLRRRIVRLETGMAWAEDPPSRTRHLFTNIRVVPTESAGRVHRPLQLPAVPHPPRARRRVLRRGPRGPAAPGRRRRRLADRPPQDRPRPVHAQRQEPEHVLLMTWEALVNGVVVGGVSALLAVGISQIFAVTGVLNFAHAGFAMLAAYLYSWLAVDQGWSVGCAAAMAT